MSLQKFEGKSLQKLIDTVSAGIGVMYKMREINKDQSNEEYRIEKLEEAKSEGLVINSEVDSELFQKVRQRLIHKEVNRQINLDNIVEKSAEYLDENISEDPVDEDWRTKYFSKAQDVSSDEMQDIWARILADEVSKPGTISLRTLEIISNLSKNEAEIFEKLASLSLDSGNILKINSNSGFSEFGIEFGDLLTLRAANLVFDSETLVLNFQPLQQLDNSVILKFGNKIKKVFKADTKKYSFGQVSLTPAGKELMKTLKISPNYEYFDKFIEAKSKEGYTICDLEIKDMLTLVNLTNLNS